MTIQCHKFAILHNKQKQKSMNSKWSEVWHSFMINFPLMVCAFQMLCRKLFYGWYVWWGSWVQQKKIGIGSDLHIASTSANIGHRVINYQFGGVSATSSFHAMRCNWKFWKWDDLANASYVGLCVFLVFFIILVFHFGNAETGIMLIFGLHYQIFLSVIDVAYLCYRLDVVDLVASRNFGVRSYITIGVLHIKHCLVRSC